ncbi:hypothetical protein Moror_3709 [Moniliophthora roreri MCA 2997]|uniref:Uncharacterized protein n=1 Tax=Moniliophthora roreri (strain MCA 2997) TaxID=1381753 RepID=V2XPH7_MONRO|nr:hypothetical protein Moror_3709 [Moniliophthora roreri MCA 2997]
MPSSYLYTFLPNSNTTSTDPNSITRGLFLGYSRSTNPSVAFSNPAASSLTHYLHVLLVPPYTSTQLEYHFHRSKSDHQTVFRNVFDVDESIGSLFEPGAILLKPTAPEDPRNRNVRFFGSLNTMVMLARLLDVTIVGVGVAHRTRPLTWIPNHQGPSVASGTTVTTNSSLHLFAEAAGRPAGDGEWVERGMRRDPENFQESSPGSFWAVGCIRKQRVGGDGGGGIEFEGKTTSRVFGDVVIMFRDPENPQESSPGGSWAVG